jgi:hypothetical protein
MTQKHKSCHTECEFSTVSVISEVLRIATMIKKLTFISKLIIKYNEDMVNILTWHTYP